MDSEDISEEPAQRVPGNLDNKWFSGHGMRSGRKANIGRVAEVRQVESKDRKNVRSSSEATSAWRRAPTRSSKKEHRNLGEFI